MSSDADRNRAHDRTSILVGVVFGLIALACFINHAEWFSAHSLTAFRSFFHIPWPVAGLGYAAVPLMLLHQRLRLAAYTWAFLLSLISVFTLWLYTIIDSAVINAPISLLSLLVPVLLLGEVRWCVASNQRVMRSGCRGDDA